MASSSALIASTSYSSLTSKVVRSCILSEGPFSRSCIGGEIMPFARRRPVSYVQLKAPVKKVINRLRSLYLNLKVTSGLEPKRRVDTTDRGAACSSCPYLDERRHHVDQPPYSESHLPNAVRYRFLGTFVDFAQIGDA